MSECSAGPHCEDGRHGWDCPASDPLGDVHRALAGPINNPILRDARDAIAQRWYPPVPDDASDLD